MRTRHGWRRWGAVAAVSLGTLVLASCASGSSGSKLGVKAPAHRAAPAAPGRGDVAGAVPSSDTVVILTQEREVGGRPTTRRVVVSTPATVNRLREAANGLQPVPHGAFSCPMIPAGRPQQVVIAFTTAATAPPDITFTVSLVGCRRVAVTEHGHHLASLANDTVFTAAYSAVLRQPPAGRYSPT